MELRVQQQHGCWDVESSYASYEASWPVEGRRDSSFVDVVCGLWTGARASRSFLSSDASVLVSCVVAVESDGARVGGGALCVLAGGPGRWWIHLLSSPCLPVLKSCKKPQTQHLAAERERTPERLRRSQSSRRSNVGIPTASHSSRRCTILAHEKYLPVSRVRPIMLHMDQALYRLNPNNLLTSSQAWAH